MRRIVAIVGLLLLTAAPAGAGELTSTPPWLRGDIVAGYLGAVDFMEVTDREIVAGPRTEVGRYLRHAHGMHVGGVFSAYHGVAVRLDVPIAFHDQLVWLHANSLRYDPDYGRTTAVDAPPLPDGTLEDSTSSRVHNGFGDITLGFRVVPLAERGIPFRTAAASLSVDLDLTFPSGGSHDKVRENGTAGPGAGGMQVWIATAISRRMAGAEPYLRVGYLHRASYAVDLRPHQVEPGAGTEDNGFTRLNPADELRVRFGSEIVLREDLAADTGSRLNVGFAIAYVSPETVSSGTRLPAPLDPSVGHRAVTGEHVRLEAGLGARVRPRPQAELTIDVAGGWVSPHLLEQVDERDYSMAVGPGSFLLRFAMGAVVRLR